jgi:hypothetical protein
MRARLRRYQRLQYLYKLQPPTFPWPPFTHPEFPVEPALEMWRRGIHTDYRQPVWVRTHDLCENPHLLTEDDDLISPYIPYVPLPTFFPEPDTE